jgi:hypothetical protein
MTENDKLVACWITLTLHEGFPEAIGDPYRSYLYQKREELGQEELGHKMSKAVKDFCEGAWK